MAGDRSNANVVYGWERQADAARPCLSHGAGIYVYDSNNQRFMDFCSGQVNINVGYSHPHVLEAMRKQMDKVAYVAPTYDTEVRLRLAALVRERTPSGLEYVFFTSSGSESIEVAMKVARACTGRQKIYSAWRSYHGATSGASALSGDPRRLFVEPTIPGIGKFHAATCYRCAFGHHSPQACGFACINALENTLLLDCPETIAAIVIEPIVGTNGLYIPPQQFMSGVAKLCREHGIFLICDETMTGWGRTGQWFACEHFGISPDILVTAKGITSGYVPLGAVVMTKPIRDCFLDRMFVAGSTNEGHALGCAAGIANIEVYEDQDLIEKSRRDGEYLLDSLTSLSARHPCVGDVRGKGLFACLELTSDRMRKKPLAGYRDCQRNVATELRQFLFDAGLLVLAKWDFVFIAPPLTIQRSELDAGIALIDRALFRLDRFVTD